MLLRVESERIVKRLRTLKTEVWSRRGLKWRWGLAGGGRWGGYGECVLARCRWEKRRRRVLLLADELRRMLILILRSWIAFATTFPTAAGSCKAQRRGIQGCDEYKYALHERKHGDLYYCNRRAQVSIFH